MQSQGVAAAPASAAATPTLGDGGARPAPPPESLPPGFGLGEGFRQGQPPAVDEASLHVDGGALQQCTTCDARVVLGR